MAKEDKKQEQGVEATPALLDNTEVASNNDVVLEDKVKELEATIKEKDSKIAALEEQAEKQKETISFQGEIIKEQVESISKKDLKIKELEESLGDKAAIPNLVAPGENEVAIRFLLSPAGKFKLPFNVNQVVNMNSEVAAEIVEAKYAEYVI